MTILVFVGALLVAMAMGIPIAFALLASGVALMWHLDLFDAQILAQNVIGGADSFPLLAVPFFMLAVKAGHDKPRAAGLIAATGVIGPVIPPSIGLVIFGVAANVSISKLFLAAIVPGLLIGGALWVTWAWLVRAEKIVPPPRKSGREIAVAFRNALWALALPLIILVGLRMGVFTPTEAAVVAAVYALFVSTAVYRELTWKDLYGIFVSAAKTSAIVMF
ncbi:MAG: TRAP transporter large permease subunit, partial [Variovorax sp.]